MARKFLFSIIFAGLFFLIQPALAQQGSQSEDQQEEQDPATTFGKGLLDQILKPEQTQPKTQKKREIPIPEKSTSSGGWDAGPGNCSYPDCDGDGHVYAGDGGDDCNDGDPDRFPGNTEVADSDYHDEDCDPFTFGEKDEDGDGYPSAASCNYLQDGTLHCGTDCDDNNYAIVPGAQMCVNAREIRTCKKSEFRPYTRKIGWDNGHWETSACDGQCVTQPNGTGVCVR